MRRILGMLLLLVVVLPLVAPAFGQAAQQKLLACCRKGGAHHCMDEAAMAEDGTPGPMFRAHCPACDSPAVVGHATDWNSANTQGRDMEASIAPLRVRQVEAGYRISYYRSRQKRGPPAIVLS